MSSPALAAIVLLGFAGTTEAQTRGNGARSCDARCLARARALSRNDRGGGPIFESQTTRIGPQGRTSPSPAGRGTMVTPNR